MSRIPARNNIRRKPGPSNSATNPSPTAPSTPLNRSLSAANFNRLGLKKLITTSYDGSPIAGQMPLFPEYDEGDGGRKKQYTALRDHLCSRRNVA